MTRADGRDFMTLAAEIELTPAIETLPLAEANSALARLKDGDLRGAAVLTMR